MIATFRYVLITAVRDRFLGAILLAMLAVLACAVLLGSSALVEQRALGLSYAGELLRAVIVLGVITLISFHVRRMYETREVEAILARPISRAVFVLAYFAAYGTVALATAVMTAPLLMIALGAGGAGLALWTASLMLESLVVVALGLFAAMTLEGATASVLAGLGLYGIGRAAAFFRAIAEKGTGLFDQEGLNTGARLLMEGIGLVVPRLDLFGQSRWLVYGPGGGWGLMELAIQTAIFVPLLLLATIRDLQIKRF